jgi:hypothetical protein
LNQKITREGIYLKIAWMENRSKLESNKRHKIDSQNMGVKMNESSEPDTKDIVPKGLDVKITRVTEIR